MSSKMLAFVIIAGLCLAAAGAYVWMAERRVQPNPTAAATNPLPALGDAPRTEGPVFVFSRRSGSPDGRDGSIGVAPMSRTTDARFDESLKCERVHMSAGRGICLQKRGRFPVSYAAVFFDEHFKPTGQLPLAGTPSRTQVSTTGRYGGLTVFIAGHSYSDNSFSTRTSIVDLEKNDWMTQDLETWTVTRNGKVVHAADFNFWGVTFLRDDTGFYATLGTAGKTYLVKGDLARHEMTVVDEDVECPSLSPDGARIAFKHRNPVGTGPLSWSIWVLDLATSERHRLAEMRSVDDQAQWFDNQSVMYALPGERPAVMDMWAASADGAGSPRKVLNAAFSAVVVRP